MQEENKTNDNTPAEDQQPKARKSEETSAVEKDNLAQEQDKNTSTSNTKNFSQPTLEIEKMVHDGQRLLAYIAINGHTELDPDLTENVVNAHYALQDGEWNP